ncbi:NAD(P)-dependent oxidoreductase [Streptomyces sp. NPDC059816]|uniref:NAD(P)-dependent oxidoreductase n=1 Tax=Streptomyces sp. NPDC059816 TaxID=3346960 RepID=UPI003667402A
MLKQSVTLIGLGPMGQAMVSAFLDNGHEVTVWNRTASKAEGVVSKGAKLAPTVADALKANDLVILSLTDYSAMYTILSDAADALTGKTVVNLSSDTPKKTRAGAKWIENHGGRQVTGGVNASPTGIGAPESFTFYSGPKDAFESVQETLQVLSATDYKGEDPGLAALYYQLQLDVFWTTVTSWLHALAVADANGIKAEDFLPYVSPQLAQMPAFIGYYSGRIDAGNYAGDIERLSMAVASIDHVVETARDSGVDTSLPAKVLEIFQRGIADGRSEDSATSLVEIFKKASV